MGSAASIAASWFSMPYWFSVLRTEAATAPSAGNTDPLSHDLPGDTGDRSLSGGSSVGGRLSSPRKRTASNSPPNPSVGGSACGNYYSIPTKGPLSNSPSNSSDRPSTPGEDSLIGDVHWLPPSPPPPPSSSPPSSSPSPPPPPPRLPPHMTSFPSPQISQSASAPWPPTCSSMQSSHPLQSPDLQAKSAAVYATPAPSLLTKEVFTLGDDALLDYEAFRMQHPLEELYTMEQNPFSFFSAQDLEMYFAVAADVKNALQLRKSVVAVDIGDTLEGLLPRLSLYEKDRAVLETAFEEMRLIREECLNRSLRLNFFSLESFRYSLPSHRPSILERHNSLFSAMESTLDGKAGAQRLTRLFLNDASCLKERRLPCLPNSQR